MAQSPSIPPSYVPPLGEVVSTARSPESSLLIPPDTLPHRTDGEGAPPPFSRIMEALGGKTLGSLVREDGTKNISEADVKAFLRGEPMSNEKKLIIGRALAFAGVIPLTSGS